MWSFSDLPLVLPSKKTHFYRAQKRSIDFPAGHKSDSPPPPIIASVSPLEMKYSKPPSPVMAEMMISRGNRVKTDNMLNMSCTVAPEKARSNSRRSPAWAMLTWCEENPDGNTENMLARIQTISWAMIRIYNESQSMYCTSTLHISKKLWVYIQYIYIHINMNIICVYIYIYICIQLHTHLHRLVLIRI